MVEISQLMIDGKLFLANIILSKITVTENSDLTVQNQGHFGTQSIKVSLIPSGVYGKYLCYQMPLQLYQQLRKTCYSTNSLVDEHAELVR